MNQRTKPYFKMLNKKYPDLMKLYIDNIIKKTGATRKQLDRSPALIGVAMLKDHEHHLKNGYDNEVVALLGHIATDLLNLETESKEVRLNLNSTEYLGDSDAQT